MKINDLLNESINELSDKHLKELLRTDYSQAYEAALNGDYIYKGMYTQLDDKSAYYFDKIENRVSANTYNYYTLWINNSDDWSNFPNRNVIASTNYETASEYGLQTYIILPKNNTKIGVCPKHDIWLSFQNLIKINMSADEATEVFNYLFNDQLDADPKNYNSLVKALKHLSTDLLDETDETDDSSLRGLVEKYGFYEAFRKIFSPDGFYITSIENYKSKGDHEIWFDSDFIAIDYFSRKKILYRDIDENK